MRKSNGGPKVTPLNALKEGVYETPRSSEQCLDEPLVPFVKETVHKADTGQESSENVSKIPLAFLLLPVQKSTVLAVVSTKLGAPQQHSTNLS